MKLPRDLSGAEAVRALRRLGFTAGKQEGSHIRLAKGGLRVTVPNHKTLAVGTLKSILRQAQLSADDLTANL